MNGLTKSVVGPAFLRAMFEERRKIDRFLDRFK